MEQPPEVSRLLARLDELAAAIETERRRHDAAMSPLLDERNGIFAALAEHGWSRRHIARVSGVTSSAVQNALKPWPRRPRRKR